MDPCVKKIDIGKEYFFVEGCHILIFLAICTPRFTRAAYEPL